ncbi:MAG: HD domain-containing phosphohydrolase [Bacilli bacterium]|jgi:putative two-component system response regulator|nr:response regulator [Bacilli bacterium]MDD2681912.1 response regulator [Bacilli bacterium]MDD4063721.1 response regulator [Bacilli bacterium]MDD4482422.1 response regulator [Bacilli bacterium]MDY0363972.1 response regulator [Bacilli bacterium]
MKPKIIVIEDSKTDRLIIESMLPDYRVYSAVNGLEGIDVINANLDAAVVILDLNMPLMNGFAVLKHLRSDEKYKNIKVIILTNSNEIDSELKGLELGAADYVRKPINIKSLRIRIDILLSLKEAQEKMEKQNYVLDRLVHEKTEELLKSKLITINALVHLLEKRNSETYKHTARTRKMMEVLLNHLRNNPFFEAELTDDFTDKLVNTTVLHDVGKIGIPDSILLKPGKLTDEEFSIMKKHVDYGVEALQLELENLESVPSFIKIALDVIGSHHEKYDGTGYPKGLKGNEIPLSGRLMAIIDVFDALVSHRVYRKAFSFAEAIKIIKKSIGTHFDPIIGKAFLEVKDQMYEIVKNH